MGPANKNESATRKATTHLRVVNAADSQIAACHRLNNKDNCAHHGKVDGYIDGYTRLWFREAG